MMLLPAVLFQSRRQRTVHPTPDSEGIPCRVTDLLLASRGQQIRDPASVRDPPPPMDRSQPVLCPIA
ncbi:hypothetical protein EYF80_031938 [Liparis tanakae]|uniref:Uncharacterized protein n=1 Tax=Liparis tanakae TaxID=230148 RepID=A0A4Z2GWG0_9TELE|nr:hypothetical protein EYF80_031938 [Liparis tanakae]